MIIGVIDSTINKEWRVGAAMLRLLSEYDLFFPVSNASIKLKEFTLIQVLIIQLTNGETMFCIHAC